MPNTSEFFRNIRAFMQRASQRTPIRAEMPDVKTRLLRARLMMEEVMETVDALGVTLVVNKTSDDGKGHIEYTGLGFEAKDLSGETPDESVERQKQIVDGVADTLYVSVGTLVSMGVADLPAMREVCDSNDTKFLPGYSFREDGKLLKSPQYRPADFTEALKADILA